METVALSAQTRTLHGKQNKKLRLDGLIPAVIYGQAQDNIMLSVDAKSFRRIFADAGQSTIVELTVDKDKQNVLIHEIENHPVTGEITHIDFLRINMNQTIRTEVPLHFVGESPAVYQEEGTLIKNTEEVEVETLPAHLPQHIEVDISSLDDFEKTIHISDIVAPEGVTILSDPEELVAKVDPPRSEEEMAALDEAIGVVVPEGVNEEGEATEGEEGEATEGEEEASSADAAPAEDKSADKDKK